MHLISPKDIYKEVLKETGAVLHTLESTSEDNELSKAIETARDSFAQLKSKTDVVLQELEKNAEWDALTVAFYGETNAGKSTIIETLRILMGEKSKQEQRHKFRQVHEKFNIDKDVVETWKQKKQEIFQLEEKLKIVTSQFSDSQQKQRILENEILACIERLATQANALPFWRRCLSFVWKIPEKSELNTAREQLSALATEIRRLSQEHEQTTSMITAKIDSAKIKVAEIDTAMKELERHQDGEIIGDGQSDFTRESTRYEFIANGNKFVLLDVPGIEGKEALVYEPIMQAVRKAHAVFYVTRKADPPQKGDEKSGKGTLEKIKEHLGAQTEVWTIFNKSIKSAEQLHAPQLINTGEIESLKVLDAEMLKQLGKEHYAGYLNISAYPAFVASTDHFVPGNAKRKDRNKFLAVMDAAEILRKTGIQFLAEKIGSSMAENAKEKIRKSNYNKANIAVLELINSVSDLNKTTIKPLFNKLQDQARDSISQLDSATDSLKNNIESAAMSLIKKKRDNVRKKIYEKIDDDINNDDFKDYLDGYISAGVEKIENELPVKIENEIEVFKEQVKGIADQFNEHIKDFLDGASMTADANFRLNIKIDTGISAAGLIGSAIGAAILFFTGPPGWVAIAAGIAGILISTYKAVKSFFSSDFKMAQQRKAADENIEKIFRSIESSYLEQLEESMQKLVDSLSYIKKKFKSPAQQAELITKSLSNSARQLELVSLKIAKEGGL